jgi:hypothetical protein
MIRRPGRPWNHPVDNFSIDMPTVLRIGPYRFHFYSDEGKEPAHIHVRFEGNDAKFWLSPVGLARNRGIPAHRLIEIERLVFEHQIHLLKHSMNTATNTADRIVEPVAIKAWAEGRTIFLELNDGRIFGFPANRFSRLRAATEAELKAVQIEVNGYALRWEIIDEDITVPGVVAGKFELPPEV